MNGFDIHGLSERMDYYAQRCAVLMVAGGGPLPQSKPDVGDYNARRDAALQMLRTGEHTAREIADRLGLAPYQVYNICHQYGVRGKPARRA
jgi:DNA invertase Pin-like site-specific DNA recombinase